MENNWLSEFGFRKNPYDTRALSSEEGDRLLVGRDDEIKLIINQLITSSKIPILTGDNGIGKTSIANIAAYRMSQEYKEGDRRYFVLDFYQALDVDLSELKDFEKNVINDVLVLLLSEKSFLRDRRVSVIERLIVYLLLKIPITEIGVGSGSIGANPSSNARSYLTRTAQKWLRQCFSEPYGGGIICVIDNLENKGTSNSVQEFVENMRDTLFNMPGLLWILCGTPVVTKGALASKRLAGYLGELPINPVDENIAPELVQRRIEYYGIANADPPVDKELFQFIYKIVVNSQLRIALKICEDFSEHLFNNSKCQLEDRKAELKLWLSQKASRLPGLSNVTDDSWHFFDYIVALGGSFSSNDYALYKLSTSEEVEQLAFPLIDNLLERTITDDGYLLRVTENGWLVNYMRNNQDVRGRTDV